MIVLDCGDSTQKIIFGQKPWLLFRFLNTLRSNAGWQEIRDYVANR